MKLATFLLLSACAVSPPALDVIEGIPVDGHENQGTTLLGALDSLPFPRAISPGSVPPRLDRYWVSGAATRKGMGSVTVYAAEGVLFATEGNQHYSGADSNLVGLRFTAVDGSEIEIAQVYLETPNDPIRYDLIWRPNPNVPNWTDPCGEQANVISGHLTSATRDHVFVAGDLTFSCMSGVAYKCHRWGYKDPGTESSPNWDMYGACLMDGNANYCFSDQSFTRDGTAISFFDKYGIRAKFRTDWSPWELNTWPPPKYQYYVEAAWVAHGPPKCLSRARWQSLEPSPCDAILPDPRTNPGAKYCEDIGTDELAADPDIQIIGTSHYNDLAFQTWQTPGGDMFSTVDGYHDRRIDYPPYPSMTYVGPSGVLLRDLTSEMAPSQYRQVFKYCMSSTSQRCVVTTPETQPSTHPYQASMVEEGWIAKDPTGTNHPLVLYTNILTGDYVTALAPPTILYRQVATIGYVLK